MYAQLKSKKGKSEAKIKYIKQYTAILIGDY